VADPEGSRGDHRGPICQGLKTLTPFATRALARDQGPDLVKVVLPVSRYTASWSGGRLVEWVVPGGCQRRSSKEFAGAVVPEPVLTRLETADDGVLGRSSVGSGVLAGGVVATADVAALGTSAKMEPPSTLFQAFDAASAAGGHARHDGRISHLGGAARSIYDSQVCCSPVAGW
jgi:hypothetical protein